jgi:hypothetical protein
MARICRVGSRWPVALWVLLSSCGGGDDAAPVSSAVDPGAAFGIVQTNLQIASQLYADNARTPPGFYSEVVPVGQYFATRHLKSADLGVTGSTHELCTDDWNQAMQWSELAAQRYPAYAALVGSSNTDRYFEFDRLASGTPALHQHARVYQCTYLDRDDVDLQAASGSAGLLNRRPLSATELQQLSEYLWQFTSYNNYGHAVLRSSGSAVSGALKHAVIVANIDADGLHSGCDRIRVESWTHTLDTGSGALMLAVTPLWSFGARALTGGAETCS